jgi:hypothetical protein
MGTVHPPAASRQPPAAREKWQDRAHILLTREFFDREYLTARKTLHQIEGETCGARKCDSGCHVGS